MGRWARRGIRQRLAPFCAPAAAAASLLPSRRRSPATHHPGPSPITRHPSPITHHPAPIARLPRRGVAHSGRGRPAIPSPAPLVPWRLAPQQPSSPAAQKAKGGGAHFSRHGMQIGEWMGAGMPWTRVAWGLGAGDMDWASSSSSSSSQPTPLPHLLGTQRSERPPPRPVQSTAHRRAAPPWRRISARMATCTPHTHKLLENGAPHGNAARRRISWFDPRSTIHGQGSQPVVEIIRSPTFCLSQLIRCRLRLVCTLPSYLT